MTNGTGPGGTPDARAIVLGGGLAGIASAYSLARAGWRNITLIERGPEVGGLAGTFRMGEHFYPLAYHHILHRDRALLWFLDHLGELDRVRWRKIRMLFHIDGNFYDLATPGGFLRFPMSFADKARFVRLMLRSFGKSDWEDWENRSAAELVDAWGGPGVRRSIFERLSRLKFQLPCDEVSGAWLGARLHFREGSAPLGFIPETNWTKVLCEGLRRLLDEQRVDVRTSRSVTALRGTGDALHSVELDDGEELNADVLVSAIPTEVYRDLAPDDDTAEIGAIRYTAILSAICATRQPIDRDFYWMNLASLNCQACGIFRLESLNPSIGAPGDSVINFVTHVPDRADALFRRSDEELLQGYFDDFRRVFGTELIPFWSRLIRLPMYSPVFVQGYHNPPARSARWKNVYFAGNYRTFPSIASTGTALQSGLEAASAILVDRGNTCALTPEVDAFRLSSMPRG